MEDGCEYAFQDKVVGDLDFVVAEEGAVVGGGGGSVACGQVCGLCCCEGAKIFGDACDG